MFHRGELVTLTIEQYAFGGRGIAKIPTEEGQFIVFVDNAFPGQQVRAKIDVKRKHHAEAKLIEVLERAPIEEVSSFQEISGAPYIFVPPAAQEAVKLASTLSTFAKISGQRNINDLFDEYIASPSLFYYRNKMEYSFSSIEHHIATGEDIDDAFALGFKRRGTWWKVENLDRPSGLFDEDWEQKLPTLRAFFKSYPVTRLASTKKIWFFQAYYCKKVF